MGTRASLPDRSPHPAASLEELAEHWPARWERDGIYRFDRTATREDVFAIDTPPPTVNGSLHVGHVFSFTHADVIARYQRMRGRAVFYPIGWDDNGLPTEKRAQQHFNVRCEPSTPADPQALAALLRDGPGDGPPKAVSRGDFIALCEAVTEHDEVRFEQLFRRIGLSVDWSLKYTTISARSRRISQRGFLRNLARGEAYLAQAPTMWDVTFGTAVAQAELEYRVGSSAYHRLVFGDGLLVATTRPELLPACVAVLHHPQDDRYAHRTGTEITTPVFGARVPLLAHHLVDPGKGTGLVMVCTFGDPTDVIWWRELDLPIRPVLGRDGRFRTDPPPGIDTAAYSQLAGAYPKQARAIVLELLRAAGRLDGEPEPIEHSVAFYERGDRPLEIVTTWQWYLRNGGRDPELRERMLARGRELAWQPEPMRARYEAWVANLAGDWLVSRQRFHGVPIPIWYPLDEQGEPCRDRPITPPEDALPIDPSADTPPGYAPEQRGLPGGFVGEADVMDTWATSSLSPQLAAGDELLDRVFPMDLRPQAHEIIRTWLFATALRSELEHGVLPWSHAAISGWVMDPAKKKVAKSAATRMVTPDELLDTYGPDAVRYWAASGRPGIDTVFDEAQIKIGRRLAMKLLNATRFVLGLGDPGPDAQVTEAIDRAMLAGLDAAVAETTAALDALDQGRALEAAERFFWFFCDDYLELVKARAYGEHPGGDSARAALRQALSVQLRLLAPMLPFVTEEVWSWWQPGSVHTARWPSAAIGPTLEELRVLEQAVAALTAVRRAKSAAKVSMKAEVLRLTIHTDRSTWDGLRPALPDLRAAGRVGEFVFAESPEEIIRHEVLLA
ncbi:valyl-tRNA synthetase [Allocatelliglobosispora scoriae]|uniref:valine--tRNA ligase n=1 Tax=Allocatelliglobosispora scoriae TaxID=643052 RepID=A0A841BPP1_9ACTN|nr:valine--tRNA ligase [Allocatelliglobosispora scoriae]MBB5869159.1 valyl-tRNA synthetase [Allocatelliglobosispora scoriae]